MVVFICIVVFIIIVVSLSKKKQPIITRKPAAAFGQSRIISPSIPKAALDLATKHFGWEWIQFLAERNAKLNIGIEKIRESVALGYSQMGTKPLENLLLSFMQVHSNHAEPLKISVSVDMNNFVALHQAVYDLIVYGRFHQNAIQTMLNNLSEAARKVRDQSFADNKVQMAENKNRQAELRTQIAENKAKQAVLRNSITQQRHEIKNTREQMQTTDDSIIELSSEPLKIILPPEEQRPLEDKPVSLYPEYDPDQYSLGKKYKLKLNLSTQEVKWLDKFWNYSNVFNSIEGCEVEIIKLFLLSIKRLNKRLKSENSTMDDEIAPLKTKMIEFEKVQPHYWGGYDDVYTGGSVESEVYNYVYKKAESLIREAWDHKRKVSASFSSRSVEVKELFDQRLGGMIEQVVTELIPTIGQPDDLTEIALNEATTTRWKVQFQKLTEDYGGQEHSEIVSALHLLGKKNKRNPTVEHIYFEASKFMASIDKVESLKFYLYYIWKDLNSAVVDNKQLNKTIQKKIFNNEEQLRIFQSIINDLVNSRNLTAALKEVESVYKTKRKSITLNNDAILRVQEQHSGTVEKLNEYLQDEGEVYQLTFADPKVADVDLVNSDSQLSEIAKTTVGLKDFQLECLKLFSNDDYFVSATDIESFAKSRSMFKNQLIDGINDCCNELLDDILIEETEDGYEINSNYYKQILA